MAIPVQTKLLWRTYETFAGLPPARLPDDLVRSASDRRNRMLRMPGATLIVGKPHPDVFVNVKTATLQDGTVLPLRVYRPAARPVDVLPLVLYFHGGGFCSGEAHRTEWFCTGLARAAEVVIVSVDYRLAPEHPFPVAAEDCYDATRWAVAHAENLGADAARLTVMGDSAGGNLAAVVALLARDRGGPAISLQVLLYPLVDLVGDYRSADENAAAPVLTAADVRAAAGRYAGPDHLTSPYASPLLAPSHEGLPRALIQTAQHDPVRDQGLAYAHALRRSGVAVTYTNYVDAVHGYASLPGLVPASRQALAEVAAVLAAGGPGEDSGNA